MDNTESTKQYFDKNYECLGVTKKTKQRALVETTGAALKGKLQGMVLDIGGGGKIDYALDNVEQLVILDSAVCSLRNIRGGNKIFSVCGDARKISIKNSCCDAVVIVHTVHHLSGDTLAKTRQHVAECLREARRVLKKSGSLFIIATVCADYARRVEDFLFPFTLRFLRLFKKPMVYYFSLKQLKDIVEKSDFEKIRVLRLNTGDALFCPFTLPICIPFKHTPLAHVLIEGIK